jgi:hypothetical protein
MGLNYWPSIEMVTVDADVIRRAEKEIESWEYCHPDDVQIPFDAILADVTGRSGACEFILSESARCPICKRSVTEKTLVDRTDI